MKLFDAHCHLQDERYFSCLPDVIFRARSVGVNRMSCCGAGENDWPRTREIALKYEEIIPSFGLHPLYVSDRSENWLSNLKSFLISMPDCGVGEIGLDQMVDPPNAAEQELCFVEQIRLARELKRPVTIHCRQAFARLLEVLRQEGGAPYGGVLHTYSGSAELVPQFEALGLHISFSGAITRSGSKRAQKALAVVSSERLLIETDSPDILPVGASGEFNEPANLLIVARCVASLLGKSVEAVAELTYKNAERLFSFKDMGILTCHKDAQETQKYNLNQIVPFVLFCG